MEVKPFKIKIRKPHVLPDISVLDFVVETNEKKMAEIGIIIEFFMNKECACTFEI